MYPQSIVLSKNKKNVKIFHLKIIVFTAVKNRSILHKRIIVMCIFSGGPFSIHVFILNYIGLMFINVTVHCLNTGIHNFLIFALKHRLWVLVRTASIRRF